MKTCSMCKRILDFNKFCKNIRSKDGYNYQCKECVKKVSSSEEFKNNRRERYRKNKPTRKKQTEEQKQRKAEYDIIYRENNKNKIRHQKKDWESKNKNNTLFRLKRNLRRRINHVINGSRKSSKTFDLIGCTPEFFKSHIESLWLDGMSWDNYGKWHIDHIIECFRFDLTKPEDQKLCFHYSNQRPLWAKDNLSRKRT